MKVLVACEYSGVVREAFRERGFDAWSCDLPPTDIPSKFHLQGDVLEVLDHHWDLMVAHPPCTYLTVTGNRWFKPEYKDRFPNREQQREGGVGFFMELANADIKHIAVENPVGVMSTRWRKPDQIIQPYQFGHVEAKKTCLWLKNLPKLTPTKIVEPEYTTFKSGKRMATWYTEAVKLPKEQREHLRSKTFQGIANAMAEQWGNYLKETQ
jgi:hypothetical protein